MRSTTAWRLLLSALVVATLLGIATGVSAQMREFSGRIAGVSAGRLAVENRTGDQVSFAPARSTVVRGAKQSWSELAKGDLVTVSWKLTDDPRKAHVVVVRPPRARK